MKITRINIGLSTLNLSSEVMLQEGEVLGTHLARWNWSSRLWWPTFISHHPICQSSYMLNLMCVHMINPNSIYLVLHLDWKINSSECVWMVITQIQGFEKIIKQTCFSYFWCGFKIKTSVYAWTCDEQSRTCEERIRTFKHIQENLNNYYHALILNSHHGNTKNN